MPADWQATCSSTEHWGRGRPGWPSPTATHRTAAATPTSSPTAIAAHLRACTEAGITAGFHVIGDAAVSAVVARSAAGRRRARCAGGRALRTPTRAPRDGDRRAGHPPRRVGRLGERAAQLRCAVGRRGRDVCPASGSGPSRPAQPVRAVSIPRRAPRLRLRLPGHRHESVGDDARGDPASDTGAARCRCARGVLGGHPRRVARRRGPRRRHRHAGSRCARDPMRCGTPTSSRSVHPTTRCSAGRPIRDRGCPRCRDSAPTTRCRDACGRSTEVSSSMAKSQPAADHDDEPDDDEPASSDKTPGSAEVPAWTKRFGQAVVDRLPRS